MAKVPNGEKIAENFNQLSRAHERYRHTDDRQTDGTAIAYSEREREFTFAKNGSRDPDHAHFICCLLHGININDIEYLEYHFCCLKPF